MYQNAKISKSNKFWTVIEDIDTKASWEQSRDLLAAFKFEHENGDKSSGTEVMKTGLKIYKADLEITKFLQLITKIFNVM